MSHLSLSAEDLAQEILEPLISVKDIQQKDSVIKGAEKTNSAEMNKVLVEYLDDPSGDGPRQRDFKINAPWKTALGVLIKRFPSVGLKHLYVEYNVDSGKVLNYSYMTRDDAAHF